MAYEITRFYEDPNQSPRWINSGLTLAEAKFHCTHPETSSSTCVRPENVAHTVEYGPWFDGFTEE